MSKFTFPPIHDFPPFYTFQEGSRDATRIQVSAWTDIIKKYMKSKKKQELDLTKEINSELFKNDKIKRQMSIEDAQKIIAIMVESQNATYIDQANKKKVKIITRKPEEWAEIIAKWAREKLLTNSVLTFFEISKGDDSADMPFYNIDYDELLLAAQSLEKNKRGVIVKVDPNSTNLEEYGLKIYT